MRCRQLRAWLLAAFVFSLSAGCSTRPTVKKNPPPDPLLQSKTPIQAKYGMTPDAQARPQPEPPTMPAGAWAVAPPTGAPAVRLGRPDEPGPFRMTAEKRAIQPIDSEGPTSIEGVLEKSADDRWLLCRETGEKVLLEGHPRLDLFEPGYVIRVDGKLVESNPPRYLVEHVLLLRRGS
jgi:hypothetical protein